MSDERRDSAETEQDGQPASRPDDTAASAEVPEKPREIGGRPGPDPTRYGDWEKNGRCIDF